MIKDFVLAVDACGTQVMIHQLLLKCQMGRYLQWELFMVYMQNNKTDIIGNLNHLPQAVYHVLVLVTCFEHLNILQRFIYIS